MDAKPIAKAGIDAIDWHEAELWIKHRYGRDIRDFQGCHSFNWLQSWCEQHGRNYVPCPKPGDDNYDDDLKAHQRVFAEFQSAKDGAAMEPPYCDFWHCVIDHCGVTRGGTVSIGFDLLESANHDWQRWVIRMFIAEFGNDAVYRTDW